MTKRGAIAVLVLVTGGSFLTTPPTIPVGLGLLAAGCYLLALPYLGGRDVGVSRSGPTHRRT